MGGQLLVGAEERLQEWLKGRKSVPAPAIEERKSAFHA